MLPILSAWNYLRYFLILLHSYLKGWFMGDYWTSNFIYTSKKVNGVVSLCWVNSKIKSEKKKLSFFFTFIPNIKINLGMNSFCVYVILYLNCYLDFSVFVIHSVNVCFIFFQLFNQAKLFVSTTFTSDWREKIPFQPDHDKTRRTHRGR